MKKCLIDDCSMEQKIRGLCTDCYAAAKNLIKTNVTSWTHLESIGMATPKKFKVGKFRNHFNSLSK